MSGEPVAWRYKPHPSRHSLKAWKYTEGPEPTWLEPSHWVVEALYAALPAEPQALKVEARPADEWHEDIGDVLWWAWDADAGEWLGEPPYVGSPLDAGIGVAVSVGDNEFVAHVAKWPGYHTHFTDLPALPALEIAHDK